MYRARLSRQLLRVFNAAFLHTQVLTVHDCGPGLHRPALAPADEPGSAFNNHPHEDITTSGYVKMSL